MFTRYDYFVDVIYICFHEFHYKSDYCSSICCIIYVLMIEKNITQPNLNHILCYIFVYRKHNVENSAVAADVDQYKTAETF